MNVNVIMALSGGMDSATLLAYALHEEMEVNAVGFCYGSKHNSFENKAAAKVAEHYDVPFELLDLSSVMKGFQSNLMLSGGAVPEGHYEDKTMAQTVVPSRNIIFASILSGIAWSRGAMQVWLGVHAGDHAIYPDCRPTFIYEMNRAISTGTDSRVRLVAPFLYWDKSTILKKGLELGVPYELTRTCYKQQEKACGKCGACCERLEAFEKNGVVDPVEYED